MKKGCNFASQSGNNETPDREPEGSLKMQNGAVVQPG